MPQDNQVAERINLRCTEGTSNKVYNVVLRPEGDGWICCGFNGKYGQALKPQWKAGPAPVSYAVAKKAYDAIVAEKRNKGRYWVADADGAEQALPANPNLLVDSGVRCQQSNAIEDEAEVEALIRDPNWLAQIKHDGHRRLIRKGDVDGTMAVDAINRRGDITNMAKVLEDAARGVPSSFVLDGEDMGLRIHAYDLLEMAGRDLRPLPYRERLRALNLLCSMLPPGSPITLTETASTPEEKRAMFDYARDNRLEGLVFKRADAAHTPGRPNRGGDQLKFKFRRELSAVVRGVNRQRSVQLGVLQVDGSWLAIGNCTVPSNSEIPDVGSVVEVSYRHAFPSGALCEPVLKEIRTDVSPEECLATQLVYGPEVDTSPDEDLENAPGM